MQQKPPGTMSSYYCLRFQVPANVVWLSLASRSSNLIWTTVAWNPNSLHSSTPALVQKHQTCLRWKKRRSIFFSWRWTNEWFSMNFQNNETRWQALGGVVKWSSHLLSASSDTANKLSAITLTPCMAMTSIFLDPKLCLLSLFHPKLHS